MGTKNIISKAQRNKAQRSFQAVKAHRKMCNIIFLTFEAQRNLRNELFDSAEAQRNLRNELFDSAEAQRNSAIAERHFHITLKRNLTSTIEILLDNANTTFFSI